MKYGDPQAIEDIGTQLGKAVSADKEFQQLLSTAQELFISSAAYGAVPSAAHTITEFVAAQLETNGIPSKRFKITREGGFARTNYGALGNKAREKAIRSRRISLEVDWAEKLDGKIVLVIDDLRSTGAHERAIQQLFANEAPNAYLIFAYCIGFQEGISAELEEQLNHSCIKKPEDLLPLFAKDQESPMLNARMLKFILLLKGKRMHAYLDKIGKEHAKRLYLAAISDDGYCFSSRFKEGFTILEDWVFAQNCIQKRLSFQIRNQFQKKIVAWNIDESSNGDFIDSETSTLLNSEIEVYSRFKFGDVDAIKTLAKRLSSRMIDEIEEGGSLKSIFERAKERNEFISITAPGVRNVVSASNFLMRETASQVNIWLSKNGFPTMMIRSLGRLGSGTANYAELSAKERSIRQKTTQTIIPRSEYRDFPTHVIFVDDVEVSGQTANRARSNSLAASALSFHGVFAFRVNPTQARRDASIEHRLNHFEVTGRLDSGLAQILKHPDYQPVQRMLRLLLHPKNHSELVDFAENHIPNHSLIRLYTAAMNNDYLWIRSENANSIGEYGPSLLLLEDVLKRKKLIDDKGTIL